MKENTRLLRNPCEMIKIEQNKIQIKAHWFTDEVCISIWNFKQKLESDFVLAFILLAFMPRTTSFINQLFNERIYFSSPIDDFSTFENRSKTYVLSKWFFATLDCMDTHQAASWPMTFLNFIWSIFKFCVLWNVIKCTKPCDYNGFFLLLAHLLFIQLSFKCRPEKLKKKQ